MNATIGALSNIADYAQWWAKHAPAAEAVVLGPMRLSYAELSARVQATARALLAAGVQPGDRVATLATPHPDFLVTFLASAAVGAIWVGLNPRYQLAEIEHVCADADPSVLFARTRIEERSYEHELRALRRCTPALRRIVALDEAAAHDGVESMEQFLRGGEPVSPETVAAVSQRTGGRDPCLLVYTSGSTGRPKGALLCHQGIIEMSRMQNRLWPVSRQRLLNYFPVNHIGSVVDVSCPTLVAGGCIVFLEHFDAAQALQLTAAERITVWISVPSVFQMQLALPDFASHDLSAVELIVWEGAAMPVEMIRRLRNICPRLATNYGMTEATSAITIVAPTDDVDVLASSVGLPVAGVDVRLLDPDGQPVPAGTPGELQARSIYNMLGYWQRPQETAATLVDGWLRTGDMAMQRRDGRYRLVGRTKEMYKSGGYNVYPREIEMALETCPRVALAAVVGVPDPLWQEIGIAYVVPNGSVSEHELAAHCRERLANYKVPKRFVIRDSLPLLPIGKVDKVELRRLAQSAIGSGNR